jgi:hypothetical protein
VSAGFANAIAAASNGEVKVNLLTDVTAAPAAPAVYTCGSCACLFWPDETEGGYYVDRYAHVGGNTPGECNGDPCPCHALPYAVTYSGEELKP